MRNDSPETSPKHEIKELKKSLERWSKRQDDYMDNFELPENSDKKQDPKQGQKLQNKKNTSINAKLIVSHMCDEVSPDESQINISVESQGKKLVCNKSKESGKFLSASPRGNMMAESDVDVFIENSPQSSDLDDVPQLPVASKISAKNTQIPAIRFSSIEEVDEENVSTPLITNNSSFDPKKMMESLKDSQGKSNKDTESKFLLEYSENSKLSPLTKPPVLSEKEGE